MSWHDTARTGESQADTALRNELRSLLGVPARPANYFETELTPELASLADDLRREAQRRNHTAREKNSWLLLAAALPFTLILGLVGTWGVAQKRQVEALSAAVTRQNAEIQTLAAAARQAQPQPQAPVPAAVAVPLAKGQPAPLLAGTAPGKLKPKELVIPVERATEVNPADTQRVKAH